MSAQPPSLFEVDDPSRPLADRLRPQTIDDVVGQDHLLSTEAPIGRMISAQRLVSMVLWGPPGCGKTTIARLLAERTGLVFEPLSATFSGVADLRKVFQAAQHRREIGQGTMLFVDEIHRFNRAQQDSFLPYVEDGTIVLVGATTENPSFELNAHCCRAARCSSSNASTTPRSPRSSAGRRTASTHRCRSTATPGKRSSPWPPATAGTCST